MKMIIKQKYICREDLRANPHVSYLFGDNVMRIGFGGQAKEMRGEPNAIGIPTKEAPTMNANSFMRDQTYERNCALIDEALDELPEHCTVIIPLAGLGTGLAMLKDTAPKTFKYLQQRLETLQ